MPPEHPHQQRHPDHYFWSVVQDVFDGLVVVVYLLTTLFPSRALAFAAERDLVNEPLIFVRDPSLAGRAIVGIEVFGHDRTAGQLLMSEALEVRVSLAPGSVVRVLSVAYSSTPDQTDVNPLITASGARVGPGIAAANFLPFGTQLRIGQQIYTVLDRMNPRYDNKYVIDLWMPSRLSALQYGVRVVEVEILSFP